VTETPTRNTEAVDPWLAEVWEKRGTDLLLTAFAPPLMRVDGEMHPVSNTHVLNPGEVEHLVSSIVGPLLDQYVDELEVDFAFTWRDLARIRCNAFHQRETCAVAMRMIPFEIPGFQELGIPSVVKRLAMLPMGLVIVTGPTGSGKSTTLAAMIDYVNRFRRCHIVTIEDPIEYVHGNLHSAVSQREVGTDTDSFERALRSVLREDPDVLLVGEMRDLESIQTTLTIAETGHLVFTTLHTNDSAQTLDRIVDIFPADRRDQVQVQLSSTLEAVIYQRLVPRRGGGLVAAYEVLTANYAVQNLVREGKTRQLRNIIATHQSEGMQTLEMSLSELVQRGVIDYDTAVKVSLYPDDVARTLSGLGIDGVAPGTPSTSVRVTSS